MNHIFIEYSAHPLLSTTQVNNPLSSFYVSYVPASFISILCSPQWVSISTSYCLLGFSSVELCPLIVAFVYLFFGLVLPNELLSPILLWPKALKAPQIKKENTICILDHVCDTRGKGRRGEKGCRAGRRGC